MKYIFQVVDYVNKKIVNTPDDKLSSVCEEVTNESSWRFSVLLY